MRSCLSGCCLSGDRRVVFLQDTLEGGCLDEAASIRSEGLQEKIGVRLRNTSILCEALNEQACVVFGVKADPIWRHCRECQTEDVEFVCSLDVCG